VSGLAETLREAEPGMTVSLLLDDGSEISGTLRGVNGDGVDVDETTVELRRVKRVKLQFSSVSRKAAA
jgi:hypothetical protein